MQHNLNFWKRLVTLPSLDFFHIQIGTPWRNQAPLKLLSWNPILLVPLENVSLCGIILRFLVRKITSVLTIVLVYPIKIYFCRGGDLLTLTTGIQSCFQGFQSRSELLLSSLNSFENSKLPMIPSTVSNRLIFKTTFLLPTIFLDIFKNWVDFFMGTQWNSACKNSRLVSKW